MESICFAHCFGDTYISDKGLVEWISGEMVDYDTPDDKVERYLVYL